MEAVLYLRMSSDIQERSIPQQRNWAVEAAGREGVEIVGEFSDAGISGDKTSQRDGFHEMLASCQQRRRDGQPVPVIMCYSASRFSRADSQETAYYIWQFRQAGTHRILTA